MSEVVLARTLQPRDMLVRNGVPREVLHVSAPKSSRWVHVWLVGNTPEPSVTHSSLSRDSRVALNFNEKALSATPEHFELLEKALEAEKQAVSERAEANAAAKVHAQSATRRREEERAARRAALAAEES